MHCPKLTEQKIYYIGSKSHLKPSAYYYYETIDESIRFLMMFPMRLVILSWWPLQILQTYM